MKRVIFCAIWIFVLVVMAYDCHFALKHQDSFDDWETNELTVWLSQNFGMYSSIAFRCFTVAALFFLLLFGRLKLLWQWIASLSAFSIHGYLCVVYILVHFGE